MTSTAPPASAAPRELIPPAELERLNERSDGPGLRQLSVHLAVLLVGGLTWGAAGLPLLLRLAGLMLLGAGLAFAFCAMHECGHRTAFRSRWLNDGVAWGAGALSFYNAGYYRRYHQWHHRYTHQIGLDPELEDAPPHDMASYVLELSGLPWWIGKIRSHARGLVGAFEGCPYISEAVAPKLIRSIRLQVGLYAVLALASLAAGSDALLRFWLLPLAIGQPLLRFVLMAEHGGCAFSPDGLRNTRTTLTVAPLRRLMWNMPFHAEHHLYPSLPFHALREAHALLALHLEQLGAGYRAVHWGFRRDLQALALPKGG